MSDIAELTEAIEDFNNTVDLLSLNELIDALNTHSEALDRYSAALEYQQQQDKKILTKGLAQRPNTW